MLCSVYARRLKFEFKALRIIPFKKTWYLFLTFSTTTKNFIKEKKCNMRCLLILLWNVRIFICKYIYLFVSSKQISGFDSLVAFICILILWAFWLFVQLTHLVKPPHFFLQEMMPCFLYSIYINFSNCTIKYCVISFPLIMQKQPVLQKYVIFVNGEMYWTLHFKFKS